MRQVVRPWASAWLKATIQHTTSAGPTIHRSRYRASGWPRVAPSRRPSICSCAGFRWTMQPLRSTADPSGERSDDRLPEMPTSDRSLRCIPVSTLAGVGLFLLFPSHHLDLKRISAGIPAQSAHGCYEPGPCQARGQCAANAPATSSDRLLSAALLMAGSSSWTIAPFDTIASAPAANEAFRYALPF